MVDYNTAYLLIDDAAGTTGRFDLSVGLEDGFELDKDFILGRNGNFIQNYVDHLVQLKNITDISERRSGYWVDGGGGSITRTIEFKTGLEDVTWGDGSGGTGPSNVTETDASGADVNPLDRKQVMENWIRRTRTDSLGPQARLHWGQWTDGTISGVNAGVFGEPIPIAIRNANLRKGSDDEGTASMSGTLTLARVAILPTDSVPSWVADPAAKIAEAIEGLQDR